MLVDLGATVTDNRATEDRPRVLGVALGDARVAVEVRQGEGGEVALCVDGQEQESLEAAWVAVVEQVASQQGAANARALEDVRIAVEAAGGRVTDGRSGDLDVVLTDRFDRLRPHMAYQRLDGIWAWKPAACSRPRSAGDLTPTKGPTP